jgi:hypothetical protein
MAFENIAYTTELTTDLHLLGTGTRYKKGETVRVSYANNLPGIKFFVESMDAHDGRAEIAMDYPAEMKDHLLHGPLTPYRVDAFDYDTWGTRTQWREERDADRLR